MITPYGSYGLDDSLKPAGNEYGATRECVVIVQENMLLQMAYMNEDIGMHLWE